jgi:sugar lactone lactonase YvrE
MYVLSTFLIGKQTMEGARHMNYKRRIKLQTSRRACNNRSASGPALHERHFFRPDRSTVKRTFTAAAGASKAARLKRVLAAVIALVAATTATGADSKQPGSTAEFNHPWGVAVDSTGNVYVADSGNHTIRKITPAGAVSTFAGQAGSTGDTDGAGSAARFKEPLSIAIDTAGNLYVGEVGNKAIRKITPAGVVSTFAKAQGMDPQGIAVDRAGNVYVSDIKNKMIRKVTSDGVVSTFVDRVGGEGVAIDSAGNLFVADGATIRKITPAGDVSTFAGTGGLGHRDGVGTAAEFYSPLGIAVDTADNLYVTTYIANIRKITPAGVVSTFIPKGKLSRPAGIAVDTAGNLYVTHEYEANIVRITPDKAIITLAGSGRPGSADSADSTAQSPKK